MMGASWLIVEPEHIELLREQRENEAGAGDGTDSRFVEVNA